LTSFNLESNPNKSNYNSPKYLDAKSQILLFQAANLNNLNLYKEAIHVINSILATNNYSYDLYLERAYSYFGLGKIDLAVNDYEEAQKYNVQPPFVAPKIFVDNVYIPKEKLQFSQGLLSGTIEGCKISAVEFLPSLLSCCKGMGYGLWCFVCSPSEVSQEFANSVYSLVQQIVSNTAKENLELFVPEIKELCLKWDFLDDHQKGLKIGFIIGKYGTEVFIAPAAVVKGAKTCYNFRRANTALTLQQISQSNVKKIKILEESSKRVTLQEQLIKEAVQKNKILTKSSNAQNHIMQEKHAWDKLIKISGNVEEDFKKLAALLEENNIIDKAFMKGEPQLFPATSPRINKVTYQKTIDKYTVRIECETYLDTGLTFIKDGWVVTK
jgi:tetratricopeptide (TPR) repeat protein